MSESASASPSTVSRPRTRPTAAFVSLGVVVGLLTGVAAGFGSAGFLHGLEWATDNRLDHPWLLWLLPVAGLGIGVLRRLAGRATSGTNLLLNEFHEPSTGPSTEPSTGSGPRAHSIGPHGVGVLDAVLGEHSVSDETSDERAGSTHAAAGPGPAGVPVHLAPYVFVGSVLTHLFGGSGGREGAAVQIAAGLTSPLRRPLTALAARAGIGADAIARFLIVAALAGGFGSVFGVPWAGTVFGLEVARHWRLNAVGAHLRQRASEVAQFLPTAIVASWVGHLVTSHLGIHHTKPPRLTEPFVIGIVVVAVAAGLLARVYLFAHHLVVSALRRLPAPELVWPVIGGACVVVGTLAVGTRAYLGLSLPLVNAALAGATVASGAFALKLAFTAVTLGSGFPGGEVTPLLCMGACLGAALAGPLGDPAPVLAAVGMVATWAAASNTPISAAVMGAELFGPIGLVVFLPLNVVATAVSGTKGVYHAQR